MIFAITSATPRQLNTYESKTPNFRLSYRSLQTQDEDFNLPMQKSLKQEDMGVHSVLFCDGGTIFLLDHAKKKISYALDWEDYEKNGTKLIPGVYTNMSCIPEIIIAVKFKGQLALNGDSEDTKHDVFDIVRILRAKTTPLTYYVDEKSISPGRGSFRLERYRNSMYLKIHNFESEILIRQSTTHNLVTVVLLEIHINNAIILVNHHVK
jgi:hypothetical protein